MIRKTESAGRYTRVGRALLACAAAALLLAWGAAARAQGSLGEQGVVAAIDDGTGRPWAAGIPLETRKEAYRIFLDGNESMKEALFARGAEKYAAALGLWDHPAFHYNLGVAQMNLDQIIEAYWSFERSLRHGPRPLGKDKHELALSYLKMLGKQLAEVEIICDEPGAAVALDGKHLFIAPGRQRVIVRPGGHRVEATKAERTPDIQQAVLNPGDKQTLTLAPQVPEYLAVTRQWPQWIPWTVVGAGAVVIAGGGVLDWTSSIAFDKYDRKFAKQCPLPSGCREGNVPRSLQSQLDSANTQQWLARGVYVIGGATVATGAVLLYLNRERLVRRKGLVESPSVSFTPVLVPDMTGVSARFRF